MSEKKPVKMLSAADVMDRQDLKSIVVDVPEWGGAIPMRELSAGAAITLGEAQQNASPTEAFFLQLAASIADETGQPMFTVEQLRTKSPKVLRRLHDKAAELQGWKDEAAAKNVSGEAAPVASPIA